ncbi:serine/threonine-protein kinase [Streptomyces sp. NPDC059744]|uniref:serine/threonine-protein kinase n=2 Tax=unclassified Streptomyces TaxID=2593676 RepID=UPI0036490429
MRAPMKPLDTDKDPRALGPFELLAVLGQGGMGRAYLARLLPLEHLGPEWEAAYHLAEPSDEAEQRLAVVKVIKPSLLTDDSAMSEEEARARFAVEVDAVRAVVSDRVPALLAADAEAELPWLAIDYVHGPTLHAMISKTGCLPIGAYAALGLALVEALRAIHGAKLLHRDLKPGNVALGRTGPVVLDFGLAKLVELNPSQGITLAHTHMGSAPYMPLEQHYDAKHVKTPADVFGLGATLFFAAAGRPPYPAGPSTAPPYWEGINPACIPLLAQILVPIPEQRPTLDAVEESLLVLLIQNGIAPETAAEQLRKAVEASGLIPDLPPQAQSGQVDPAVRDAAQKAVDDGAAPDSPWAEEGADLFDQFFGPAPEEPLSPDVEQAEDFDAPQRQQNSQAEGATVTDPPPASPDGYIPTILDPAADSTAADATTSYPLAPPGPADGSAPPPALDQDPSEAAPPAARKAAERLRKAYAHSARL